jgi:integral membrane protein (TIGR01906 family)
VDFGDAFVQFHLVAFSNDLWILDPTRDHLLMLFPEGFWFDATMRIAGLTALEAAALAVLGAAVMRWAPSR